MFRGLLLASKQPPLAPYGPSVSCFFRLPPSAKIVVAHASIAKLKAFIELYLNGECTVSICRFSMAMRADMSAKSRNSHRSPLRYN